MVSTKINERNLNQELINALNEKADQSDLQALEETINEELEEVKKSASDGKALIASAITNKGVTTAADASFNTISSNISSIVTVNDVPNQGAQIITPSTSNIIIPAGTYLTGAQTIAGDTNLISNNIKSGVSIFGITGNSNVVDTSAGDATAAQILSGKKAYVDGKLVTGSMTNNSGATVGWSGYETITVQPHPSDSSQGLITISNQYGSVGYFDTTSKITGNMANLNASNIKAGVAVGQVNGNSSNSIVGTFTSDANATAAQILSGKTAYVNGAKITGTIASQGAQTITPGTSNKTIAAGKYLSGAQTIMGDANLVAGNIKKGTSIFGVTGTYDPILSFVDGTIIRQGYTMHSKNTTKVQETTLPALPYLMEMTVYSPNNADSMYVIFYFETKIIEVRSGSIEYNGTRFNAPHTTSFDTNVSWYFYTPSNHYLSFWTADYLTYKGKTNGSTTYGNCTIYRYA